MQFKNFDDFQGGSRPAPMRQQSGTLLFCSCHGIDKFFSKKNYCHLGEHLKKMTPNSDLQFINKETGISMAAAK